MNRKTSYKLEKNKLDNDHVSYQSWMADRQEMVIE